MVQISLLIVTFLSLISQNLSLLHTTQEVKPHPRIIPYYVNMWSVIFFFFLNVTLVENIAKKNRNHFPIVTGSFDHLDLQALNDYKFFFFVLWLQFKFFWGM